MTTDQLAKCSSQQDHERRNSGRRSSSDIHSAGEGRKIWGWNNRCSMTSIAGTPPGPTVPDREHTSRDRLTVKPFQKFFSYWLLLEIRFAFILLDAVGSKIYLHLRNYVPSLKMEKMKIGNAHTIDIYNLFTSVRLNINNTVFILSLNVFWLILLVVFFCSQSVVNNRRSVLYSWQNS